MADACQGCEKRARMVRVLRDQVAFLEGALVAQAARRRVLEVALVDCMGRKDR